METDQFDQASNSSDDFDIIEIEDCEEPQPTTSTAPNSMFEDFGDMEEQLALTKRSMHFLDMQKQDLQTEKSELIEELDTLELELQEAQATVARLKAEKAKDKKLIEALRAENKQMKLESSPNACDKSYRHSYS